MNTTTRGTCSICGGAVTEPTIWGGIVPPTPSCSRCGAVPAEPHGPIIPMKPAPPRRWTFGTMTEAEWRDAMTRSAVKVAASLAGSETEVGR